MGKWLDTTSFCYPGGRVELFQLDPHTDVTKKARQQLLELDIDPAPLPARFQLHVKALRVACRSQKLPGLLGIVLVVGTKIGVCIIRALSVAGHHPGEGAV